MLDLALVDMTYAGATTQHVLHGSQWFRAPQVNGLSYDTDLVTLTVGGNDINYVGDLTCLADRRQRSLTGWFIRSFWSGPFGPQRQNFAKLQDNFVAILQEVRCRAPNAKLVVTTYPNLLPTGCSCAKLGLDADEVEEMRLVGEQLAEVTRAAASKEGAFLVDMYRIGAERHACSDEPWVNGALEPDGIAFHLTYAGAKATAEAIANELATDAENACVYVDIKSSHSPAASG